MDAVDHLVVDVAIHAELQDGVTDVLVAKSLLEVRQEQPRPGLFDLLVGGFADADHGGALFIEWLMQWV
ncbi:hypothetical protein [Arthrobacter sp. Hiyo1]|uniref:hypothetical protein n=1 Tax=Arthrobacter sp. Hiyo1 TaxID=1588020 RepID=UPI0007508250|nr:hypothetical protein [Arthrobacter sp. Hiyo1]